MSPTNSPAVPGASAGGLPRLADGRGLTYLGAVALVGVLGGVGAAVDLSTGLFLGLGFGIAFVSGCMLAALLVHPEDLRAIPVMPPLMYVLLVFAAGTVNTSAGAGSLLVRSAVGLVNAVILGAPVLLGASVVTLALCLLRRAGARR